MCISKKENLLSISAYNVNFEKVVNLLRFICVNSVTVFVDKGNQYSFQKTISICELEKHVLESDNSLLIFNDYVAECLIDKEIDTLFGKKIMIDYNLGESLTHIFVNLNNVEITKDKIKEILK